MIKLTQEQFDNIDIVCEEVRKIHPSFAHNGSKDAMKISGISEVQALVEIGKIDIPAILQARADVVSAQADKKQGVIDRLKTLGFDDEDIEIFNLKA